MESSGNTILITGGGSGIGRELARRFQMLGNHVIVAGRRRDALEETIGGRDAMTAAVVDVADIAALPQFAHVMVSAHPALNVLINNAGIMRAENVAQSRALSDDATIATNLTAPIHLIDALHGQLRSRAGAAIINVSSGLAFVPMSTHATYCATKAAIHSYTQSLRVQLAGEVEVIELIPPAVQTGLTPGQATREGYMPLDDYIDEVMAQFAAPPTPPEILVDRVKLLRNAEAQGRYETAFQMLNTPR